MGKGSSPKWACWEPDDPGNLDINNGYYKSKFVDRTLRKNGLLFLIRTIVFEPFIEYGQ